MLPRLPDKPTGAASRARREAPDRQLTQSAAARAARILDVLDLVERHVDELAADLLDLADIDRLHDVAGLGIDRHRAARAVPFHSLGGGDQGVAVGLAAGLLQRLVDRVHAVVAD